MRLAAPLALVLLVGIIWLVIARNRWRREEPALALPSWGAAMPSSLRARIAPMAWPVRAACIAALILALARPQWGFEETSATYRGIDIMVALDVSNSMWADDIQPDRMTAAKEVTQRFVAGLEEDRVGLVLFSGEALTYSPLTTDLEAVGDLVERVEVQMVLPSGTNMEAALLSAAARFDFEQQRTRVVILVTDGEQTVPGYPVEVGARACEAKHVRVYTIGVGRPEGAFIRLPPSQGGDILRDPFGQPIRTKLDEVTLQEIARVTGGQYWRAETAGQLQEIFDTIAQLEKGELKVSRRVRYEERMELLIWPAAVLLLLDGLIFGAWCRRTV
ncbi:MAG: VWA domain-containing protein [Armatimonadia bacterium]|nr:VWA domain-containing protein [Armatimonadia bacterium]